MKFHRIIIGKSLLISLVKSNTFNLYLQTTGGKRPDSYHR